MDEEEQEIQSTPTPLHPARRQLLVVFILAACACYAAALVYAVSH